MKDYGEVVAQRYDERVKADFSIGTTFRWMPSQLNLYRVLYRMQRFAFNDASQRGMDFGEARFLEVGCGDGRWTRFIAEVTHKPENITGTDLSAPRIALAKKMNPAIDYQVADVVSDKINVTSNVILAWDVFMHLPREEEIRKALKNINTALAPNGLFIVFESWAGSHFRAPPDSESWGYHPDELKLLVQSEGFKPVYEEMVFKVLPWLGHSEQLYGGRLPDWFIHLLERTMPGKPGNFFQIYLKTKE